MLRVYLSARQGDGDNGAVRTCYHGYQSHQLLNSLFHSFRRKLGMTGAGRVEVEASYCIRCVGVCVCVCVCVSVKCTVVKILKTCAMVWPHFPAIAKEDTIMSRMKVGIKEKLRQRELNAAI